jgi:hypothetical protein
MKAKISAIDPTGVTVESTEFYIPVIESDMGKDGMLEDGTIIKYESMCQNRHILEIGNYQYYLLETGKLISIEKQD